MQWPYRLLDRWLKVQCLYLEAEHNPLDMHHHKSLALLRSLSCILAYILCGTTAILFFPNSASCPAAILVHDKTVIIIKLRVAKFLLWLFIFLLCTWKYLIRERERDWGRYGCLLEKEMILNIRGWSRFKR